MACLLIPRHALFNTTSGKQTASLIQVTLIWVFTVLHSWHFTQFVCGLWRWSGGSVGVNDSGKNTIQDVDRGYFYEAEWENSCGWSHRGKTLFYKLIYSGQAFINRKINAYEIPAKSAAFSWLSFSCQSAESGWLTVGHNDVSLHRYLLLH